MTKAVCWAILLLGAWYYWHERKAMEEEQARLAAVETEHLRALEAESSAQTNLITDYIASLLTGGLLKEPAPSREGIHSRLGLPDFVSANGMVEVYLVYSSSPDACWDSGNWKQTEQGKRFELKAVARSEGPSQNCAVHASERAIFSFEKDWRLARRCFLRSMHFLSRSVAGVR